MSRPLRCALLGIALAAPVAAQNPAPPIPIADAEQHHRRGDTVTIAGRVTAGTGELQSTAFDISVQDSSGGIRIFSRALTREVHQGDSVISRGVIQKYRGNFELVASAFDVIPGRRRMLEPVEVPIDKHLLPQLGGRLVRVRGRVAQFGTSEGGQFLRLRDIRPTETGTLTIWVPANHGAPVDLSRVQYEDSVVVTGVITAFQDNPDDSVVWQIVPRDREDIHVPETPQGIPNWVLWGALGVALLGAGGLVAGRWSARRQLRALRETEVRYRQLLELTPDAVLVHTGGDIRFANPAAVRLLGLQSEQELSGRSIHDFVHPDFQAQLDAPPEAEPGRSAPRLRGQLRSSTGRLVDVEVTASPCVYLDRPAIVVLARDITQQLRYERDLHSLALIDELTGLANRRGFALFAEQELSRARRERRTPIVVFADIDKLKQINDQYGHAAGDDAIKLVAGAFKSILRESDIVARWGGDEFVALIGEGGERAAEQIGARLTGAIAALRPSGLAYLVRASVGMSALDPSLSFQDALERADAALYAQKKR